VDKYIDLPHLIYAIFITLGGILSGILIEKFIIPFLLVLTKRTKPTADDIIVKSFKGKIIFITTIIALHFFVIQMIHLDKRVLDLADNTILVLAIIIITLIVKDLVAGVIYAYIRIEKINLPSSTIIINFTGLIITFAGFITILRFLNVNPEPILTAMGLGGLAIALALQDTLSNLFSGLQIVLSRKLIPGDYVKLNTGQEGYVKDIAWRNTTLVDLLNNTIVVPNSKLGTSIVTNYKMIDEEMSFEIQVGVSYDSNLDQVEKIAKDIAREVMAAVPGSNPNTEPFFHYHTFSEYSILFTIRLVCYNYSDSLLLKHEYIKRLHKKFRKEGIEIPYPIRQFVTRNVEQYLVK
jgi:small-conductance mechanosensitive channel